MAAEKKIEPKAAKTTTVSAKTSAAGVEKKSLSGRRHMRRHLKLK